MNDRKQIELLKKHYVKGLRVELISVNDDFTDLKKGDLGTITKVDDIGQIHVNWDNGSTLALVYSEDKFIAYTPKNIQ
ncbi:TPA: DUF4314 domain-containing protein [Staphylococcus aureus]|uniref:DUF4314 domain-containing protein n=1 Tax=Staphylococcus TaxID=1279 RepID=UPI0008DB84CC|nr:MULTISPECIES: DUF4314 domain-containing protein [Staphylococcus]HDH6439005.1 DUF4314 domain-containing protein [Staphylococcus aureus MRSA-Lux-28]MVI98938.1 DUF4314 domain-containing protein [Staphylococcus aureus]MVJ15646.1 DUF4314 domain-containing protein [Staphylococcus aureus]OHV90944.1 DUF4314 domain-containing protein [Staphylococcus aureus]HAZ4970894.1 DUF4314 domain-containing protein [Staphylococcus aureus]